jgi:twitching motility protein PilT
MAAALRLIPALPADAAMLGIPEQVQSLVKRNQGLLLVVGPTGAGKTTTLACLVERINTTRSCRIVTVEDPIEYVFASRMATIDQREVGADTDSFSAALKHVLRQDPDVILVGEMRDLETISSALTAAETGHLVLATLHTNDAIQSINRIIDVFPAHQQPQVRSQLAASLLGVVSQRLIPRADGKGRVAAFETMVATNAIRAVIRDDKMHQALSLMEASRGEGMQTMDRALFDLVRTGEVDIEEAARHARSSRQFIDLFEAPPASPAATGARTAANPAIDPTAKNKNRS